MSDETIRRSREHFDAYLHTGQYRSIHADEEHLERLLDLIGVRDDGRYLDLGTGNGYVAFALARRHPGLRVDGLDIAANSIRLDNEKARAEGLAHAVFSVYNGGTFPYPDGVFDGVVCRYSFHHYPDPAASVREIGRVLAPGGFFLLSDPLTFDGDASDFINEYQKLRADGHVRYYRRAEATALFAAQGFREGASFESGIRYPRPYDERYGALLAATDSRILALYDARREGDEVKLTVKVMNVRFEKG